MTRDEGGALAVTRPVSGVTDAPRTLRVVCADDSPAALALIERQLARLPGVEVVGAVPNGESAVQAVRRLRPDLVVLDVAMPVMDGLEAAEQISTEGLPTKILVLSAFATDRMHDDARRAGADAYLEKSIGPEALLTELRRLFPDVSIAPPSAAAPEGPTGSPAPDEWVRQAVDTLPAYFAICRPERDATDQVTGLLVEFINLAGLRALGRPAERVVGRSLLGLLPGAAYPGLLDRCARVLDSGRSDEFDLPILGEFGVRSTFAVTAAAMEGRIVLMGRDVTGERRRAHEIVATQSLGATLLDAVQDGVVVARSVRDEQGRITDFLVDYANQPVRLGRHAGGELVGRRWSEFGATAGLASARMVDRLRTVVQDGEPLVLYEERLAEVVDGQPVDAWFDLRAVPCGDGVVMSVRDVTARVHGDRTVTDQLAALGRSNADLQEFAYTASHDLTTPLQTALGFAQLLRSTLAAGDVRDGLEQLDYVVSGVRGALSMLTGLLAYSRVQTEAAPFAEVELGTILRTVIENVQGQLRRSGGRIDSDPLPAVEGDPTQLLQLLQNLITNALTYARPGVAPVVRVSAERRNGEWEIAVTDNGIGIPEVERERVFRLFQRGGDPAAHAGTGVGLALCRRIVDRHGGRIWIESAPEAGTSVRFTLTA